MSILNQTAIIGLFGQHSLAGFGAAFMNSEGTLFSSCTLLGYGQGHVHEPALKQLASWGSNYQKTVVAISNGVMFSYIDAIISKLIARYPDMSIIRVPVQEEKLSSNKQAVSDLKTMAIVTARSILPNLTRIQTQAGEYKKRQLTHFKQLKRGLKLSGLVLQKKSFGLFVDIGLCVPGLLHTSANQSKLNCAIGNWIAVEVKHFDPIKRKISLVTPSSKPVKTNAAPKVPANTAMADALMKLKRGQS